ncbi:MAG: signal peptidase II [Candidatus Coatesbacteria bacterium]|nr:signal peptidase II [Candidatus Coatesbacteria bacterium]
MSLELRSQVCSLRSFFRFCLSSWLFPVALLVVLLSDQATKLWIRSSLVFGEQRPIIDGFLNMIHTMNRGIAFGFLSGNDHPHKTVMLSIGALIAVVAFSWFAAYYGGKRRSVAFAVALLIGGTLGNLIDRMSYGGVIDFIDVHYKNTYHWPAFNIADAAVSFATLLILVRIAKHGFKENASLTKESCSSDQVLQPSSERELTEG